VAAALIAAGGTAAAAASGCGRSGEDECFEKVDCKVVNDDGTSNGYCWGTCVPGPMLPFDSDPVLVWMGSAKPLPTCPEAVPGSRRNVNAGFVAYSARAMPLPSPCPACACSAPACELPAGVTASSLAVCQEGPGGIETPFYAPPGWDGACFSPGTVPAERFGSYTIPPATLRPCAPLEDAVLRAREDEPPEPELEIGPVPDFMVSCGVEIKKDLCDRESLCMLDEKRLATGWRHCRIAVGSHAESCTAAEITGGVASFTDAHYFQTRDPDLRACSPCTCTQTPLTSTCEALVSTYEDTACGGLVATTTVDGEGACIDPPSAMSLGSLSAEWTVNEPGSCAPSGGTREGEEPAVRIVSVCCLPEKT
jgi:hypothetical protein